MSIAFLTRDFTGRFPYLTVGGCAYYRCALPLSVAGQRGSLGLPAWDPYRGFGVKETSGTGIFGYKTVVLKLIMDRSTPRQIELAQRLGQRIIVDIDDYYDGLTEANAAYDITHPDKNKWSNRDNYAAVIERADMLTVSTPFLLEHHARTHPDVRMVRNGVNMFMFQRERLRPVNNKPVLGWIGAVNYRNNDLEQLREWLPDFLETHDLRFHHSGHQTGQPTFADITGINPLRLTTSPLVPLHHYPDQFKFDIGLVPLNDIPFNHAKSNIKGLEYVASGIPYVASDLPEYRLLHETGVGTIARTADDWVAGITELLNHKHREKRAKREWEIAFNQWSIEARADEWRAAFATA